MISLKEAIEGVRNRMAKPKKTILPDKEVEYWVGDLRGYRRQTKEEIAVPLSEKVLGYKPPESKDNASIGRSGRGY